MTNIQKWILDYICARKGEWISPTKIGNAYRPHYHSAWASPRCKALVKQGLLERNDKGWYRPSYKMTEQFLSDSIFRIADELNTLTSITKKYRQVKTSKELNALSQQLQLYAKDFQKKTHKGC